jgi:hypothetical protein
MPKGFVYRVIRKRAPLFATIFAVLFTIIAVAQYAFVRRGIWSEEVSTTTGSQPITEM